MSFNNSANEELKTSTVSSGSSGSSGSSSNSMNSSNQIPNNIMMISSPYRPQYNVLHAKYLRHQQHQQHQQQKLKMENTPKLLKETPPVIPPTLCKCYNGCLCNPGSIDGSYFGGYPGSYFGGYLGSYPGGYFGDFDSYPDNYLDYSGLNYL